MKAEKLKRLTKPASRRSGKQSAFPRRFSVLPPSPFILHLLVWSAGFLVYFLLLFRLLRICFLDFEAMTMNFFQLYGVNIERLSWGRFFILYGALPLVSALVASLGYRFISRHRPVSNPLARLRVGRKLMLGGCLFLPYLGFAVVFSRVLAVWVSIEVFWWIEWYDNILPTMEWILGKLPFLVLPGLGVLGLFATFFVFSKTESRGKKHVLVKIVLVLLSAVACLGLLVSAPFGLLHLSRFAGSPGLDLFVDKCGTCHERSSALFYIKTPVEWGWTVEHKNVFEKPPWTKEEENDLVGFLTGMRSFSDRWTFRTRCQRCHFASYLGWEDRRPEEWTAITERLARWSPYYYRPLVRDQVVNYLETTRGDPDSFMGLDKKTYYEYQRFSQECGQCHSISHKAEKYRRAAEGDTRRMVTRMGEKREQPYSEMETERLTAAYRRLINDPALLDRLFPHDRPILEGGLPW